jgi:hypothetical protein
MAAALSSMGRSLPSRAMRRVWFPSPTVSPRSITFLTGCSTGSLVVSLMMRKTCSTSTPAASASFHPVSASATGLR